MNSIQQLQDHIQELVRERNWGQFHTPKNIAISLTVEAAELLEIFRWKDFADLSDAETRMAREEIGDIFVNLLNFCAITRIDPVHAASEAIKKIAEKYPKDRFHGSADKYSR